MRLSNDASSEPIQRPDGMDTLKRDHAASWQKQGRMTACKSTPTASKEQDGMAAYKSITGSRQRPDRMDASNFHPAASQDEEKMFALNGAIA